MITKVVNYEQNKEQVIKEASEIILNGGLVVFPTETVYGLGANALNSESVQKIFIAKGRPQDNPLIVHVASFEILEYVKEIPHVAKKLMEKFWPGPLTLIFNKTELIPDVTSGGLDTLGVRMPDSEIALNLIKATGVPLAAPSANISGKPSPTEVTRCIEDLNGKVDYIIGGNRSEVGLESTIVDCTVYPPCVLRPGGITLEMLKEVDENIINDNHIKDHDIKPKAPGMKYRHYAPKAELLIINGKLDNVVGKINGMASDYKKRNKKVGILATDETKKFYQEGIVYSLGSRNDLNEIANNLFEYLRKLDDDNVDIIFSESFDEVGVGLAIMNRLKKAASNNILEI